MIPLRDNLIARGTPFVTMTIVVLNVLIFVWDREGRLFAPGVVFADLTMRPAEVMAALRFSGDWFATVTVFTSMFLHANWLHLLGNVVFFGVFGQAVEAALGPVRFAIYYLFWGVCAAAAHIFVDPTSNVPTLGASGAIGGALGAYLLLFPGSRVEFLIPPFIIFRFVLRAWVLLTLWFLAQVFLPQEGVANWAHAGGFLAGMLTVLILGGRRKVLRHARLDEDHDFED